MKRKLFPSVTAALLLLLAWVGQRPLDILPMFDQPRVSIRVTSDAVSIRAINLETKKVTILRPAVPTGCAGRSFTGIAFRFEQYCGDLPPRLLEGGAPDESKLNGDLEVIARVETLAVLNSSAKTVEILQAGRNPMSTLSRCHAAKRSNT